MAQPKKRKRMPKIAHYSEMPFWVLIVSDTDCLELQLKDKRRKHGDRT